MSNQQILEDKYKKRENRSIGKSIAKSLPIGNSKKMVMMAMSILVWVGLLLGGYFLANQYAKQTQQYIDQRLDKMQATNQEQMHKLERDLATVQTEMTKVHDGLAYIDEELKLTGKTIGGSDKTKQALQQRIDQLNQQLIQLKTSLKKLEDATRAY
ncbi:hypothetical protein ACQCN2_04720 [Brevibacillus ginsengisoli]|uniref:hypothetical protein n=1 Tax=Brevibacillus ginsengisoli TaxID=363854 RepID=UPI003CFA4D85